MSENPQKTKRSLKRVTMEAGIIGRNLKILREEKGYSQKDVSNLLDVSFQQIQKYESGRNRFPIEKLFRLKHIYNVPYDSFFRGLRLPLPSRPIKTSLS